MKASNELIKLPQLSATMREMSAEMMKVRLRVSLPFPLLMLTLPQSGIISEMIDDTLEMDEDSELEDEADEEVDKVLYELTDGKLGQAGAVTDTLPVRLMPFRLALFTLTLTLSPFIGTGGAAGRGREYGSRDATYATRTTRSLDRITPPPPKSLYKHYPKP